jgi:NarL family two-component system response regulator LiaR
MRITHVYVVDDHDIFRRGVAAVVASEPSLAWAGEATGAAEACRWLPERRPDVALVALGRPQGESLESLRRLMAQWPATRFIALSCSIDPQAARAALAAGVAGYMLKTLTRTELLHLIHCTMRGQRMVSPEVNAAIAASERDHLLGTDLTPRERGLLALMARGLPNNEISASLNIGVPTVKYHVTNILAKLNADNRTAAVLTALRLNLVEREQRVGGP